MPPTPEDRSWNTTSTPDLPSDQPSPHSSQSSSIDSTRRINSELLQENESEVHEFSDEEGNLTQLPGIFYLTTQYKT